MSDRFIYKSQFLCKLNDTTLRIAKFYEFQDLMSWYQISNFSFDNKFEGEKLVIFTYNIYYLSYSNLISLGYQSYHCDEHRISDEIEFMRKEYPLYVELHILQKYMIHCHTRYKNLFMKDAFKDYIFESKNEKFKDYNVYSLIESINNHIDYLHKLEQLLKLPSMVTQ